MRVRRPRWDFNTGRDKRNGDAGGDAAAELCACVLRPTGEGGIRWGEGGGQKSVIPFLLILPQNNISPSP